MFDNKFWVASAERAIKTFAQTLVALLGTEMVGIHTLDWGMMISTALTATVLSVLTSLASANFGKNPGPSLVDESTHPDTVVVEVEVPAAPKKAAAKKATSTKK